MGENANCQHSLPSHGRRIETEVSWRRCSSWFPPLIPSSRLAGLVLYIGKEVNSACSLLILMARPGRRMEKQRDAIPAVRLRLASSAFVPVVLLHQNFIA